MCISFSLFRIVDSYQILLNAASTAEVVCARMIVVLRMMLGGSFCDIFMLLYPRE
jgi:hypothetical protein